MQVPYHQLYGSVVLIIISWYILKTCRLSAFGRTEVYNVIYVICDYVMTCEQAMLCLSSLLSHSLGYLLNRSECNVRDNVWCPD